MADPNLAFELRVQLYHPKHDKRRVIVRAFDDAGWDSAGRVKLTIEVRHGGSVIFPRGQLHCALHGTSDGIAARELVLSCVAMRPGDTDAEYFEGYTPGQLEWCSKYGEMLWCENYARYYDKNGNPKK